MTSIGYSLFNPKTVRTNGATSALSAQHFTGKVHLAFKLEVALHQLNAISQLDQGGFLPDLQT